MNKLDVCIFSIGFALFATVCFADIPYENGQIFHFDFAKAGGKIEIASENGAFKCVSKKYPFTIQNNALRSASGAQFSVAMPKKASGTAMTFSCWLVINGKPAGEGPGDQVVAFKGVHPYAIEYALMMTGQMPVFCYKNVPGQNYWKGIYCDGRTHTYADKKWIVPGTSPEAPLYQWTHVIWSFDKECVRIFINGRKTAEHRLEASERLKTNTLPLLLGGDKVYGSKDNYSTANLLFNDQRLWGRALTESEVIALYNAERPKYPKTTISLPECVAYLDKSVNAFDPDFSQKMPITAAYEKRLQSMPPKTPPVDTATTSIRNGKAQLFFNGQPVYPMTGISSIPVYTKPELISACHHDFAAAGIRLLCPGYFDTNAGWWTGERQYNWSWVDDKLANLAKAAPEAKFMLYLFPIPPEWYFNQNPGDRELYYIGKELKEARFRAPLSSKKWLKYADTMLRELVTHIERGPYGNRVYAYLVGGGVSAEWYWPGTWEGVTGYSETTKTAFRTWLKANYHNDVKALQKAWKNSKITFENALVPSPAERQKSGCFAFRDDSNRPTSDFIQFMNDATTENILVMCKAAKEATGMKKLVLTYNGYCVLYHGQPNMHNNGLRTFSRLIDSPYLDGFITPIDYGKRRGGDPGFNINPFYASAKLRGKMIWQEDDLRTHFLKDGLGRTASLDETLTVMQRCFAYSLTSGGGFWFYSLNHPALFHGEEMLQAISQFRKLGDDSLKEDCSSVAQVALIVDEEATRYLASTANGYLNRSVWHTYRDMSRMGAPFDTYLVGDLANPKMPDYKLYIFLNSYCMDQKLSDIIAKKVRKNNAVSVWCYAPGAINEGNLDLAQMKRLTGMEFKMEKTRRHLCFSIPTNSTVTKYVNLIEPEEVGPIFTPSATALKILGTAEDKPVMAAAEFSTWRSVYTAVPLNKELLMGLCDYAGVHIYSRSFDVLDCNKSFLMLHTSTAGKKTIRLPRKCTVQELFSGKTIITQGTEFTEQLPEQATRLYLLK